ncbi:MAG: GNAT family N-acetyltransferase [Chitinophagales bacterium]
MQNDLAEKITIEIELVNSDNQVAEILQLQQCNLPSSLGKEEMADQGFVTVQHDPEVLKEMNKNSPSIIATHHQRVVGYALVMTPDFRNKVPVLEPMFRLIEELTYENLPLSSYNYFIMGQVCIEKNYRGRGLFSRLYTGLRTRLSNQYNLLITEVASRNKRSINSHLRVGLKVIHQYKDLSGEQWELMVWDWRD